MPYAIADMPLEDLLEFKGIRRYVKAHRDGRTLYLVTGSLDLSGQGLRRLPDLTALALTGNFNCSRNDLASLRGCPYEVGGAFFCEMNPRLRNLHGLPDWIGGTITSDLGAFATLTDLKQQLPALLTAQYRKAEPSSSFVKKFLAVIGLDAGGKD